MSGGLAVPVKKAMSLQAQILRKSGAEIDKASPVVLDTSIMTAPQPDGSNPAEMTREARVLFSHSTLGAPILACLDKYEPLEWTARGYRIPSEDESPEMKQEMETWLTNFHSPPGIYIMEKYSGMTNDALYRRVHGKWQLAYFWTEVAIRFQPDGKKAIVACILGMEDDILGDHYLRNFIRDPPTFPGFSDDLSKIWGEQVLAPGPKERLEAFEGLGELPERNEKGQGPQRSFIDSVLEEDNIGFFRFTEKQVAEMTEVIFLHSEAWMSTGKPRNPWEHDYVYTVKDQFRKLTWEHQVDIRLLVLLTATRRDALLTASLGAISRS
ncbi:hypothetical protein FRB94_009393 [Tulasnella sp. JGI-2019a]|nr:hypothetical protein FRB94_009393 [Tulasnella sp. JGI-2019a]